MESFFTDSIFTHDIGWTSATRFVCSFGCNDMYVFLSTCFFVQKNSRLAHSNHIFSSYRCCGVWTIFGISKSFNSIYDERFRCAWREFASRIFSSMVNSEFLQSSSSGNVVGSCLGSSQTSGWI